MNVTDYTYLMNKPDAITEKQADALGSVLNEFPYFQSARALRLKGLYSQNSFKYNYALKVTAAHTGDRAVLFDFITSESFTSIQNEYYDQKLKDLLEINVFDSEIVSIQDSKKTPEVRIDPIEQSILNSIREATNVTFEETVKKIEDPKIETITEQSILDTFKEVTPTTFQEPVKTEEPKIEIITEQSILDTFKEVTPTTFQEPVKTEESKIKTIAEESILNSIIEATNIVFEEPVKIEEQKIEPIIESSILDSFKEVTTTTFEEPVKTEEQKIEPIIESSILDSFKEVTTTTFEEPVKIEEPQIETIAEEPVLAPVEEITPAVFDEPVKIEEPQIEAIAEESVTTSVEEITPAVLEEPAKIEEQQIEAIAQEPVVTPVEEITPAVPEEPAKIEETKAEPIAEERVVIAVKKATLAFFEEIVDDEIPEVRVDPIEQSILNSIKEATTVVFEEPKISEKPQEVEIPEIVKVAEENLEIGKPLDFSFNEKHSFQEWLQLSRTEPIDRTEEGPEETKQTEYNAEPVAEIEIVDEDKKKKAEIIDKFIETNPKISPIKQTAIIPAVQFDLNKEDNSYLMTETLARVYLEQKKYTKAIQAYEILILKYPEKISFFADRISDIKILQQNNNNN
jgi:hypothetical protein